MVLTHCSATRDVGDVAVDGIFGVGVLLAAHVDAGEPLEAGEERSSCVRPPDKGERHVERHDGDEEEIARGDDSGERGGQREHGLPGEREKNGEADEGEGDEEGSAEVMGVEQRSGGAALVDSEWWRRTVRTMWLSIQSAEARMSGQRGKLVDSCGQR